MVVALDMWQAEKGEVEEKHLCVNKMINAAMFFAVSGLPGSREDGKGALLVRLLVQIIEERNGFGRVSDSRPTWAGGSTYDIDSG